MFGILTLITGLSLSIVAAYFAILGIMAIFAGLPIHAAIMGIVIEAGKIVGVTWIYRNWENKTKLKYVMIPVVFVTMLLTSMGIFGLLSKAHLDQIAPVSNNIAKIERLDQRIAREHMEIADAKIIIDQLDETIQVLVDFKKISHLTEGSRIVRIKQQPQRNQLKKIINESMDSIDQYEDKKLLFNHELNNLELEIGPVKYIAAIIYEDPSSNLDKTVRIVIIAFIFVFDPMAILLLMAGNYTLMGRIGAKPVNPTPPISKPKKLVANADTEFVPAEVIAEVMAEVINESKDQLLKPLPGKIIKENKMDKLAKDALAKAKSNDILAEPTQNSPKIHSHGIHSKQFYKGE